MKSKTPHKVACLLAIVLFTSCGSASSTPYVGPMPSIAFSNTTADLENDAELVLNLSLINLYRALSTMVAPYINSDLLLCDKGEFVSDLSPLAQKSDQIGEASYSGSVNAMRITHSQAESEFMIKAAYTNFVLLDKPWRRLVIAGSAENQGNDNISDGYDKVCTAISEGREYNYLDLQLKYTSSWRYAASFTVSGDREATIDFDVTGEAENADSLSAKIQGNALIYMNGDKYECDFDDSSTSPIRWINIDCTKSSATSLKDNDADARKDVGEEVRILHNADFVLKPLFMAR